MNPLDADDMSQKLSSKDENRAMKEPVSSLHITPPTSPLINRQPISPKSEAQLRAACAGILQNYKPSDHALQEQDRIQSEMEAMRAAKKESRSRRHEEQARRHQERLDLEAIPSHKFGYKPDKQLDEIFDADSTHPLVKANIRVRRDAPSQPGIGYMSYEPATHGAPLQTTKSRSSEKTARSDRPRTAPITQVVDSSADSSPKTNFSDREFTQHSTALTSAPITPGHHTRYETQHTVSDETWERKASEADAAAADWMKQTLDKRRQKPYFQHREEPSTPAPPLARPPSRQLSRKSSFTNSVMEYVRPGSRNGSRPPSRSSNAESSTSSNDKGHREGRGGFSWQRLGQSLQRKRSGSLNSSRPSSRGASEQRETPELKPEINLNRELPPLPSLDQWQEPEPEPAPQAEEQRPQPPSKTHIAALMAPTSRLVGTQSPQPSQNAPDPRPAGSRVDSVHSSQWSKTPRPKSAGFSEFSSQKSAASSNRTTKVPQASYENDFDVLMSGLARHKTGEEPQTRPAKTRASHSRHLSNDSTMSPVTDMKSRRLTPNFSRKVSVDHGTPVEALFPNTVQISATPPQPTKAHKAAENALPVKRGGFRALFTKKSKKQLNWMDTLEKGGVKQGVIAFDSAAGAPVVRY